MAQRFGLKAHEEQRDADVYLLTAAKRLQGSYDFSLRWSVDAGDAVGTSIFAALQEQLGLKLVPAKRPVEFVLVDHAEEPSPN